MARLKVIPDVSQSPSWVELMRFSSMLFQQIVEQINGNLQFGQNIRSAGPYQVEFANGTDPVAVAHNFGAVPSGFLVINLDAGIVVYKPSGLEWTRSQIWLRATSAGSATLYLV